MGNIVSGWFPSVEACPFVRKQLLEMSKSVDMGRRGESNETPLFLAANFNAVKAVSNLIERGATTDARDTNGNTALHWAATDENVFSCKVLLQNGANVNSQNKYRETPLLLAAYERQVEVVNVLLNHGADTTMKNKYGETARDRARGECADVIEAHENKLKTEKMVFHRPKCCFCCPKFLLRRKRRKVYHMGVQLKQ